MASGFLDELKRRNVYKVGVAYLGISWVISQVAALGLESFEAPGWVIKAIIILLLIGLPVALIFGWIYELTPEGLKKTEAVEISDSTTRYTGKRLNYLILGLLSVIIVGLIIDRNRLTSRMLNPVEVLTQPAMTAMQRKLKDKKVAVLPFTNNTNSQDLEAFGALASDYITEGLMHVAANQVINISNTDNIAFASISSESNTDLVQSRNVEVLIQGRYYLQESQLIVHCHITDVQSNAMLKAIRPIQGHRNDMMKILEELKERLLGYWSVGEMKRYEGKPPLYSAYQAFLEGEKLHSQKPRQAVALFEKAHQLDSTYFEPIAKMCATLVNIREEDKVDSLLRNLRKKDPELTRYEALRFRSFEAEIKDDREERFQIYKEMHQEFPNDPTAAYMLAFTGNQTYRPYTALKTVLQDYPEDISTCKTCWAHHQVVAAWMLLGEYDKIVDYEERLHMADKNAWYNRPLLYAQAVTGRHDLVKEYLKAFTSRTTIRNGFEMNPLNYYDDVIEGYYHARNDSMVLHYGKEYLAQVESERHGRRARIHFLMGNYQESLDELESLLQQMDSPNLFLSARFAIVHEALGNEEQAKSWLDSLLKVTPEENDNVYWNLTEVYGNKGDQVKTLEYLKKHVDLGAHGAHRISTNAYFMRDVFGSKEYLDIVIKPDDRPNDFSTD